MRNIRSTTVRRALALVVVATFAAGVAACSSSSKPATGGSSSTSLSTVSVPPRTTGQAAPAEAVVAINMYEAKHGPALGTWLITSVERSSADASYVMYRLGPATPKVKDVQPGYGFAHLSGGTWTVVAFGSDRVGCPPGAPANAVVPVKVITGFALPGC